MAVVELKPYSICPLIVEEGYENEMGDFVPGYTFWGEDIACDIVSSGKANEMVFEDGEKKTYTFVVYMAPDVRDFLLGETVRLTMGCDEHEMTVKGFRRYQHQCKLWV